MGGRGKVLTIKAAQNFLFQRSCMFSAGGSWLFLVFGILGISMLTGGGEGGKGKGISNTNIDKSFLLYRTRSST